MKHATVQDGADGTFLLNSIVSGPPTNLIRHITWILCIKKDVIDFGPKSEMNAMYC